MNICKQVPFGLILVLFICFFFLLSSLTPGYAENGQRQLENDIDMVWAQSDGTRSIISLSERRGGTWSKPEFVIDYSADSLHPIVDRDKLDRIWITWTAVDGKGFAIHYSIKQKDQWQTPKSVNTVTENNIAPFILVDEENIPFIVWTGNNDDDDDIYFSRFIEGRWLAPKRLHPDNNIPDILPILEFDETGRIRVKWEQFTVDGYKVRARIWDGHKWKKPSDVRKENLSANKYATVDYSVPGRFWDGRQWRKSGHLDSKNSMIDKQKIFQVNLPEFVSNVDNIYLRIYKNKRNK